MRACHPFAPIGSSGMPVADSSSTLTAVGSSWRGRLICKQLSHMALHIRRVATRNTMLAGF
jgi:hypothetical protein